MASDTTDATTETTDVPAPQTKPRKRAAKAPATKRASRARKPASEPDTATTPDAPSPDVSDAAPAPVKRARRTRKKAEPEAVAEVVDETAGDETAGDGTAVEEIAAETAAEAEITEPETDETTEPEATESETDESAAEDDADEPVASVPSFGLLFQAPEPVAPRRRRASAAAGAPAPRDQDPHTAADAVSTEQSGEQVAAGEPDEQVADEQGSDGPDESQAPSESEAQSRRSRRRGGRGRRARGGDGESSAPGEASDAAEASADTASSDDDASAGTPDTAADESSESTSSRRRRRRRRGGSDGDSDERLGARARDEVTALKGSTRLEAKKQRRREGREAGRRRQIITEAEFLARRESVERVMVVREKGGKTQMGVLEDGVLVEHYISRETGASMIGNVYLGRVQNVLPSMEAAFVDIGKGRNAVLYAGEVNWDAAGLEGNVPKRIENALTSGDTVLVQVTKDPIGHKGARLTSQVSLPGRFLVYVPEASMTGISRKLPDTERARLKSILKRIVPADAGVIVRTAAEGASEEELTADIERLTKAWERIQTKAKKVGKKKGGAPVLLHGEPDLTVKVIRDVFNEDFTSLVVSGKQAWKDVSDYLEDVAPELAKRLTKWTGSVDLFTQYRVDEQLAKALDRKVWLPSGGSLVIDRTEAMTVVDVNTGKFVGSGGNLEETVTKNNIEAAEEIVRQLRLRDIGGIIVIDFIDMVLESNRDLVVRRLLECLGRDRTKHQVAEVTSLGLVQMTRKRVGSGLLEVFSEPCSHCAGRGVIVHSDPVDQPSSEETGNGGGRGRSRGRGGSSNGGGARSTTPDKPVEDKPQGGPTAAQIAAAAHAAALKAVAAASSGSDADEPTEDALTEDAITDDAPAAEAPADITVTDVTGLDVPTEEGVAVVEPVQETDSAHTDPGAEESPAPARRPRRRRGRVIAQAGPPGQAQVQVVGSDAPATS